MIQMNKLSRRDFLKTAGAATGGAVLVGPTFSKVLAAGDENHPGNDISEALEEYKYEGWGKSFRDYHLVDTALESITNSVRKSNDRSSTVAPDNQSPFLTSQYGNFRRNHSVSKLIEVCRKHGTQAVDGTVKNWMYGLEGHEENGKKKYFGFKVLVFLKDETRAILQLGYNNSDPFGMAGENILSLIDAFDTKYKDGSRIIDSLTWIKAVSKADESIDVMDHDAFVYVEKNKLYAGQGVKPNEINNAYKFNELVRIPKKALLRLVDVHFNGELDGVKRDKLEELLTYCPPESPLNPDAGNCYIEVSSTPNVVVIPVAKDDNGRPQNIWVPDTSIKYALKTTQTNLAP